MACASCGGGRQLTPNVQRNQMPVQGHQSPNQIRIGGASPSGAQQMKPNSQPQSKRTKV